MPQTNLTILTIRIGATSVVLLDQGISGSTPVATTVLPLPLNVTTSAVICNTPISDGGQGRATAGQNITCDVIARDTYGNSANISSFDTNSATIQPNGTFSMVFNLSEKVRCVDFPSTVACRDSPPDFVRLVFRVETSIAPTVTPLAIKIGNTLLASSQVTPATFSIYPAAVHESMSLMDCQLYGRPVNFVEPQNCTGASGVTVYNRCFGTMSFISTRAAATSETSLNATINNGTCDPLSGCLAGVDIPYPNNTILANNALVSCTVSLRDFFGNPTGAPGLDPLGVADRMQLVIHTRKSIDVQRIFKQLAVDFNVTIKSRRYDDANAQRSIVFTDLLSPPVDPSSILLNISGNFTARLVSVDGRTVLNESSWGWLEPGPPNRTSLKLSCSPDIVESVTRMTDAELSDEWLEVERFIGDPGDRRDLVANANERQCEIEAEQNKRAASA